MKPNGGYLVSKTLVADTRHLLQPIERFSQAAHIIRVMRIPETQWLMHVDSLMKITMQKGILNIELMNGPGPGESNGENGANGRRFHHRAESLLTVHSCNL